MGFTIQVKKRHLLVFSVFAVLATLGFVIAYGTNNPPVFGHSFGELEPCPAGQILKSDANNNWVCAVDTAGGGSLWSQDANGINYPNSVGIGTSSSSIYKLDVNDPAGIRVFKITDNNGIHFLDLDQDGRIKRLDIDTDLNVGNILDVGGPLHTNAIAVRNGKNLELRASLNSENDPGDIVFLSSTGTEFGRLFTNPNTIVISAGTNTNAEITFKPNQVGIGSSAFPVSPFGHRFYVEGSSLFNGEIQLSDNKFIGSASTPRNTITFKTGANDMFFNHGQTTGAFVFSGANLNLLSNNLNVQNGNLNVAGSKNFKINHPTNEGQYLIHSSLEGPEAGVYYRGTSQLREGITTIKLPEYFEDLTREEDRTIILTNIDGFDQLSLKTINGNQINNGKFIVYSDNKKSSQKFNWEIKAIRADIEKLQVEVLK